MSYNSVLQSNNTDLQVILNTISELPNAGSNVEITLQDKTVTPSTSSQTITADSGYDGLETVTVNAIPSEYITTNDATAEASKIMSGETAYANGKKITGTFTIESELSTQDDLIAQTQSVVNELPEAGSGEAILQDKTVTPSENSQIIIADDGYDGLDTVIVNAIPSAYVKPSDTKSATTYTPTTSDQTIAAGTYCSGVQTIKGDANLIASNIKSGISIFGITGTASSGGSSGSGSERGTCTVHVMIDPTAGDPSNLIQVAACLYQYGADGKGFRYTVDYNGEYTSGYNFTIENVTCGSILAIEAFDNAGEITETCTNAIFVGDGGMGVYPFSYFINETGEDVNITIYLDNQFAEDEG